MDLIFKQALLFNDQILPQSLGLRERYKVMQQMYDRGETYILLNNINVFAPFAKSDVPWDISEEQKIATYNPEVVKILNWVRTKIIKNLGSIDYRTLDVLIRIATGMLNKCNIPKETQIRFHDHMVHNLQAEYILMINEDLPF